MQENSRCHTHAWLRPARHLQDDAAHVITVQPPAGIREEFTTEQVETSSLIKSK